MPFVLIFIGALLTVAAVNNTQGPLFTLVKGDFTGNASFAYWVLAIVGFGSLGYWQPLKKIVDSFLLLLFAVFLLANRGFFTQFNTALNGALTPAPANSTTTAALSDPGTATELVTNPQGAVPSIMTDVASSYQNGANTIQKIVNQLGPSTTQGFDALQAALKVGSITGINPNAQLSPGDLGNVANGLYQYTQAGQYNPTTYA